MRLRPAAASLVLAATLLLGGGEVWAAPPLDLPGELVDDGGALADPEAVRVGQEALHHETGRQLFVAVVDDLDGLTPAQWLAEPAQPGNDAAGSSLSKGGVIAIALAAVALVIGALGALGNVVNSVFAK